MVLAGKHSTGQWRPRGQAAVQGPGHRDQLSLHGSLDQAVFDLQPDEGRPPPQAGKRVRLRDPPGRRIRDADVEHFALANQIIEPRMTSSNGVIWSQMWTQ